MANRDVTGKALHIGDAQRLRDETHALDRSRAELPVYGDDARRFLATVLE